MCESPVDKRKRKARSLKVDCANAAIKAYLTDSYRKMLARGDFATFEAHHPSGSFIDDDEMELTDANGSIRAELGELHNYLNPSVGAKSIGGKLVYLTVRPKPGHGRPLSAFVAAVEKFTRATSKVPADCSYIYVFEQIGTSGSTMGEGWHMHMLYMRGKLSCKEIVNGVYTAFGCESGWTEWEVAKVNGKLTGEPTNQKGCFVKFRDPETELTPSLKYLLGLKKEDYKWLAVKWDVEWRQVNNLQPYYSRGEIMSVSLRNTTMARIAERLQNIPASPVTLGLGCQGMQGADADPTRTLDFDQLELSDSGEELEGVDPNAESLNTPGFQV